MTDHNYDVVEELVETSRRIAAESTAVANLTRESLITDNKKFRRRNSFLVFLVSVLIVLVGTVLWREITIVSPQRDTIEDIALQLEECTTPGPRTPTPDDPTTGHKCFDESRQSQAEAIGQIIDADGNGKFDSVEILAAIKQFEQFLTPSDEDPAS